MSRLAGRVLPSPKLWFLFRPGAQSLPRLLRNHSKSKKGGAALQQARAPSCPLSVPTPGTWTALGMYTVTRRPPPSQPTAGSRSRQESCPEQGLDRQKAICRLQQRPPTHGACAPFHIRLLKRGAGDKLRENAGKRKCVSTRVSPVHLCTSRPLELRLRVDGPSVSAQTAKPS